jgi:hypothetical protein
MKKYVLLSILGLFILSGISACKAKHCTAMDPTMEGYNAKKDKKKRGRQEGLFGKQKRR